VETILYILIALGILVICLLLKWTKPKTTKKQEKPVVWFRIKK